MRPYHVAIVGSGPSGYFAAASLLKFADATDDADVRVDMLEMLPTPWGLVRSGVAPGPSEDQVDQRPVREDRAGSAVPVLRQHRGRRACAGRRAGRALRRGDLRRRRAVRPVARHSRRGPARQRGGRRLRRLVQRAPALRGDGARPFERSRRCRGQRQRRAGRGAHPGHRSRRAGDNRHRRPRVEVAARPRRRRGADRRPSRTAAGSIHHAGTARARPPGGSR